MMGLPPSARSRSGRNGGRRRAPIAEINVTPMVDVMLVLLIIFMVTAPLLVAGIPVQLPKSQAGALDQDQKPLDVALDKSGALYVDKAQVPLAAMDVLFAKARAQAGVKPRQVFLRADKALDYGRVMLVMGALNHAGLNRVALVTVGDSADGTK